MYSTHLGLDHNDCATSVKVPMHLLGHKSYETRRDAFYSGERSLFFHSKQPSDIQLVLCTRGTKCAWCSRLVNSQFGSSQEARDRQVCLP